MDQQMWNMVKDNPAKYGQYLDLFPNGCYSNVATKGKGESDDLRAINSQADEKHREKMGNIGVYLMAIGLAGVLIVAPTTSLFDEESAPTVALCGAAISGLGLYFMVGLGKE